MSIEAMKQALEALEYLATQIKPDYEHSKAITSLRQAIEQAEKQEPVAFNAGVPPLYPEMKDGETISVEYITPPAAPVQEPVAWCVLEPWLSGKFEAQDCFSDVALDANVGWVPLYTTPQPQREWVGLTDEDVAQFETWYDEEEERKGWVHPKLMANYFEAKLRSKNT